MISTEECKFEVSVKQDLLEVYFPIIYQPEKKNYCMGKKEGILFFLQRLYLKWVRTKYV